jgi:hypothetical protein
MSKIIKIAAMLALAGLISGLDARGSAGGPPPNAPTDKDPRAYKGLTRQQINEVRAGKVVLLDKLEKFEGRYMVTAVVMFNQDIDTVFNLLNQSWRHPEFQPQLVSCKVVKKWDTGLVAESHVKVLFMDARWREVIEYGKAPYYRTNDLDPSYPNDVKVLSGRWQFFWVDNKHTLGRDSMWIEPNFPIPESIQEYLIKYDLPNAVNNLRRWIDSGGTYRKQ